PAQRAALPASGCSRFRSDTPRSPGGHPRPGSGAGRVRHGSRRETVALAALSLDASDESRVPLLVDHDANRRILDPPTPMETAIVILPSDSSSDGGWSPAVVVHWTCSSSSVQPAC